MNESQSRLLNFIKENNGRHIYIYGAGRVAIPIAKFLLDNDVSIEGFVVTDKKNNRSTEVGLPVYQLDELKCRNDETAFVLGVKEMLNSEIREHIESYGYKHILEADKNTRNFGGYGKYFYETPMIEITTRIGCKVNCKYCPQEVFIREYCGRESDTIMSFDTFKKCLDNCPSNMLIEFAGFAEPFLVDDIMRMIKYASSEGFKINLFTTLVGATPEIVDELLKYEFEEFVLHAPDEEGHACIPIDEDYLTMIDKLVSACKKNGEPFITYACSQGTISNEVKKHLGRETRTYISLTDRAGNLQDPSLYGKRGIKGKIKCSISEKLNHNVLLPDGRVVLCAQDWGLKHVLGNLKENTFDEIQNGCNIKKIYSMLESFDDDCLCRNCCHAINC